MKEILGYLAAILAALTAACSHQAGRETQSPRYLFYLHGAIVEEKGPLGVSERYGAYDYPGILDAFRSRGLVVMSEVRPRGTDVSVYADKTVEQVRELIASGVDPSRITIVGASKGSIIAALVSARLKYPKVRYVLLAACNPWLIRTHDPRLTGEILSIYDASDELVGSCADIAARSTAMTDYQEVRLQTGLGHGIVYRPLSQWVEPALVWANR